MVIQKNYTYLIRANLTDLTLSSINNFSSLGIGEYLKSTYSNFYTWCDSRKITYAIGRSILSAFYSKILLNKELHTVSKNEIEVPICRLMRKGKYGKPYITTEDIKDLLKSTNCDQNSTSFIPKYFNISHSGNLLYVIISHYDVGLDIEKIKPRKTYESLKNEILSLTEKKYLSSFTSFEQELKQFFYLWTIRETLVKTTGRGILGMDAFNFDVAKDVSVIIHKQPNRVQLDGLQVDGNIYTYDVNERLNSYALSYYVPKFLSDSDIKWLEYDYIHCSFIPIHPLELKKKVVILPGFETKQ
ncbi:MAG: 4'-phosphopantetheinyl transferase family protein [Succinivibrionaceae bacterium]